MFMTVKEKMIEQETFAQNKAFKSTVQIFHGIRPSGSGVLFQHNSGHYLISAGHVLEGFAIGESYIPGEGDERIQLTNGDLITTKVPTGGNREDDLIDISIFKLNTSSSEAISKRSSFLTTEDILINNRKLLESYEYYCFGYPISNTQAHAETKTHKVIPLGFRTKAHTGDTYGVKNFPKYSKFKVIYDQERLQSLNMAAFDPKGISGSGLWEIPFADFCITGIESCKLVGILTDHYMFGNNLIVATRMDLITEIIRQRFDPSIEKSQVIKVNIDGEHFT